MFPDLQYLKKRSKIIEIVSVKDVIFVVAQSGLCAAFSRSQSANSLVQLILCCCLFFYSH